MGVIEGTATYGAQLTYAVVGAGYEVAEAPPMNARAHRGGGESDPLDARRIAEAALPVEDDQLRHPRHGDGERAAAVNALTALVRTVDLGADARRSLSNHQIVEISRWRTRDEPLATATSRAEAVRLARRIVALDEELAANHDSMETLVRATPAAGLRDKTKGGPITAAVCPTSLVAPRPGPLRSRLRLPVRREPDSRIVGRHGPPPTQQGRRPTPEPRPAMATITRMIHDPTTRAYVQRRRAEGRATMEIRRCLKHYLARQIYRHPPRRLGSP